MKTKMTLIQRLQAFIYGRQIYYIKSLKRLTFASSKEHCAIRFAGHEQYIVRMKGFWDKASFILTGNYPKQIKY